MADSIPTDLIVEILLKLPVKSLIRFTVVCKSWQSLITSPFFISSHLSNNNRNRTIFLRRYDKHDKRSHYSLREAADNRPFEINSSSELEFPFQSQNGYFNIVGSCDGVVCLWEDRLFASPSQPVILWNPSVRNHLVLPTAIINPTEPHIVVLGFGVANDVYKVVRLVYCTDEPDNGLHVEILSLNRATWRRVSGVDVRLRAIGLKSRQAFLNGVVHWLAREQIYDGNGNSYRSSILAFQIGDEVFREVMLPDELAREVGATLCITVIGESLATGKYDGGGSDSRSWDVWVMKEYGVKESWAKLYRVDLRKGVEQEVVFAYNLETRRSKGLGICKNSGAYTVYNYVESLLLFRVRGHSREACW